MTVYYNTSELSGCLRLNGNVTEQDPICHASGYCWSNAQRAMDLDEVVCEITKRNSSRVVLDLLAKCVRQSGVSPVIMRTERLCCSTKLVLMWFWSGYPISLWSL